MRNHCKYGHYEEWSGLPECVEEKHPKDDDSADGDYVDPSDYGRERTWADAWDALLEREAHRRDDYDEGITWWEDDY